MSPLQPARSPTGRPFTIRRLAACASILAAGALLAGCGDDGDTNIISAGSTPATTPASTIVERRDPLPGVVFEVTAVAPGTGPGGNLQAGDTVSVTFTLTRADGTALPLAEMDSAGIILSGPTDNYQRVFPQLSDVKTQAVENADGSYTYTFADPLPAVYAEPLNDTTAFGLDDGELQGEPLRDGTYTVAVQGYKYYTVDGEQFRDPGAGIEHVLVGSATTITPREVIKNDNCNQCHVEVRAHGGGRMDVNYCVLCHTAGAEDKNVATVENGTPGVSVDFRTMIHKIHNGVHLPSVQGVSSASDGSRQYDTVTAVPVKPYKIVGYRDSVHDFSHIIFPVWPNYSSQMPSDVGYAALPSAAQGRDTQVRRGVTDCARCHGDPDGAGPLTAPAQGDLIFAQPTRNACGSCHDDIDWTLSYKVNSPGFPMPPQPDDTSCKTCHAPSTLKAEHLHPFMNPAVNPGIVLNVTAVANAANPLDTVLNPGERVRVTFTVKDDAGAGFAPTANISATFAGPLSNLNRLLGGHAAAGSGQVTIPVAALTNVGVGSPPGGPYEVNLPEPVPLEFLGAVVTATDVFTTSRAPHWNMASAATTIVEFATSAAVGSGNTTLSAGAAAGQLFIDVAGVAGFGERDYARLSDASSTEYVQVGYVENGSRLWLTQALRNSFITGAALVEATSTTRTVGTHYTLTAATGTITGVALTPGRDLVALTYTTDFVMPAVFPTPANDTPDLDESWGEWAGKPLLAGLYRLTMWNSRTFSVVEGGTTQNYTWPSLGATKDVDVIDDTGVAPTPVISSVNNCSTCHVEILFHGGSRRGFDACVGCHGNAGFEDRPLRMGTGGTETPGVVSEFRQMLHRIHMGEALSDTPGYVFSRGAPGGGGGSGQYTFDEIVFPPMNGGTKNCDKCHGEGSDSWKQPASRSYPGSLVQARVWAVACTSCHNDPSVAGHAAAQTGLGLESCLVCHGPGKEYDVEAVHLPR